MSEEKTKLKFQVIGPKIMKCNQLLDLLQRLVDRYELNAEIIHEEESDDIKVENFSDFPLLFINGRLLLKGRAPGEKELIRIINRMLPVEESIVLSDNPKPEKTLWVKWRMAIFVIAIIIFVITKFSWKPGEKINHPMSMKDSIQQEYNYVKNGKDFQMTYFEFGSKYCKSCKQMQQVVEKVKTEFKGVVSVINVDVRDTLNDSLSNFYHVSLIPYQLLLDSEANVVFKNYGYISFDSLSLVINSKLK
ncbi:MAG: thioredoxin family protein [Bacteroidales bacterium]|nr:thioredoxin family protein [Bacteroidales bacterium]